MIVGVQTVQIYDTTQSSSLGKRSLQPADKSAHFSHHLDILLSCLWQLQSGYFQGDVRGVSSCVWADETRYVSVKSLPDWSVSSAQRCQQDSWLQNGTVAKVILVIGLGFLFQNTTDIHIVWYRCDTHKHTHAHTHTPAMSLPLYKHWELPDWDESGS